MAGVRLEKVTKRFGRTEVIRDVDLEVADGEFLVVVGPSGCGKSTVLRLIAGLEEVTSGRIWIGGKDVTNLPPAKRGVSMVFQSYALYPHMDAYKNIAFGLQMSGTSGETVDQRVRRVARMLQIDDLLHRKPRELSGGQRQRVAIARAIVREPQVFLFDEPLSNLDAALRAQTRLELTRLHDELKATMIYVTHDQLEAMTLADRIVLLNAGRIEQAGKPTELYQQPATRFVAEFIGSPKMNILPVTVEAGVVILPSGERLQAPVAHDGPADLGIRPENIALVTREEANAIRARVLHVDELGESRIIHAALDGRTTLAIRHPADRPAPSKGDEIAVRLDPRHLHLFAPDGSRVQ
ncbi:MAG TPA: ABC transporter ATP-binding protein [Hyphomicrobiaceae bacterium]